MKYRMVSMARIPCGWIESRRSGKYVTAWTLGIYVNSARWYSADTASPQSDWRICCSWLSISRRKETFQFASIQTALLMTVVDVVTSKEEQEQCRIICEGIGAKLRVRPFEG